MIRVAVVDDHPVFRDGTAAVLGREVDMDVVALGSSLDEALAIVNAADAPDVLILDVRLGEENGLKLLGRHGRTAVIVFSAFDYPQYHHVALRSGAAGFVAKSVETRELIKAVRAAAAGRLVFDRQVEPPPPVLTPRETDVVRLVADGRTNEEVGFALGVTSKTVEAHLGRIFERTGIQTRTELATRAIREAWLDRPAARAKTQ
ncbi:MAG: response regulator transcription factor [Chloroflexi bacterium]|nr:response regulator transcription factor [Chloroflexota bacterium]